MEPDDIDGGPAPEFELTGETVTELEHLIDFPSNPLNVVLDVAVLLEQFDSDEERVYTLLRQVRDIFA